ncbi:MAG TPA: PqqD family protein [Bryobacteraceae bacterium]|nr:PqqD family protein [Bryobacteraceae bacterium]
MKPILLKKKLAIAELSGETVIYDLKRHRAHCLNTITSAVWRFCEGANTPNAIARRLHHKLGWAADEALVRKALQQLAIAGLIETEKFARTLRIRRRAAGGISLVSSIVVPTPAAVRSRERQDL